jgi:hypothetical protein
MPAITYLAVLLFSRTQNGDFLANALCRLLAIDAQDLRHFLLELSVTLFQVIAHLVRLDFLSVENLANRARDQRSARLGHRFALEGDDVSRVDSDVASGLDHGARKEVSFVETYEMQRSGSGCDEWARPEQGIVFDFILSSRCRRDVPRGSVRVA